MTLKCLSLLKNYIYTMKRRDILKLTTGLLLFPNLVKAGVNPISMIASRFFPSPDYNRLTLEFNKAPTFKSFTLDNPNRVVVDLPSITNIDNLSHLNYQKYTENNIVKNIRTGPFNNDITRLVVEINRSLQSEPKIFLLPPIDRYQHRLVIDMYLGNMSSLYLNETLDDLIDKLSKPNELNIDKPKSAGKNYIIMLDPGHGGEDPGAIGKNGTYEKNIVLSIAKKLQQQINAVPGMTALLTRDGDYFVPLHVRVNKARQAKADLFISIHADASPNRSPYGTSIYALSQHGASSVMANWLAKKENSADLIGGYPIATKDKMVSKVLLDLSTTAQIEHAKKLATEILGDIGRYNKLHKHEVEQAGFAVLKAPDIPSILIETGFISNPAEEQKLNTVEHQNKLASSILLGIKNYVAKNSYIKT